MKHELK